jgi:hypothetical protein
MCEQARTRLKQIIDLLGPNVWLELDEVSFPRFFGPLRRDSEAFDAAKHSLSDTTACLFSRAIRAWPSSGVLTPNGDDDA